MNNFQWDNDESGIIDPELEPIEPKRNAERTAKAKVKYGEDDEEEEDDDFIQGMEMDENEESDYMGSDSETEKKIKKANTKPKQPKKPKSAASNGASPVKKKVCHINYY